MTQAASLRASSGRLMGVLWDLSRLHGGCLGLSWAVLGLSWASVGSQNSPEHTQSWSHSEISEIVTIPTRVLHFHFFMGLPWALLGSLGLSWGFLGTLLGSLGALLACLVFLVSSHLLSWGSLGLHLVLSGSLGLSWGSSSSSSTSSFSSSSSSSPRSSPRSSS